MVDWFLVELTATLTAAVVLGILALFTRQLFLSVLYLIAMTVAISRVFWLMEAPYVALVILVVYATGVNILALIVISFTQTQKEIAEPASRTLAREIPGVLLFLGVLIFLYWVYLVEEPFRIFREGTLPSFVSSDAVGITSLETLWDARSIDVLFQVFLVFIATTGIVTLLRRVRPEERAAVIEEY